MSTMPIQPPFATSPDVALSDPGNESDSSAVVHADGPADVADWTAAKVLVEHLFARSSHEIAGIDYAVGYRLAHGLTGGDIVDVYHFDNGAVSFSIADISGKGSQAAIHAALVKYGLRAYASQGLTAERVLRSLDRLYIENTAFERIESFASVFFGIVDSSRRTMSYASGGHEAAAICVPGAKPRLLDPTAPLIGVFDDQHHLFKQAHVELPPGSILVISDVAAVKAWPKLAAHCAAKAAMNSLVANLAVALGPEVRVNGIAPGIVLPPDDFPAEKLARIVAKTPLHRAVAVPDLIALALSVLSNQSMTGQVVTVDAGLSVS